MNLTQLRKVLGHQRVGTYEGLGYIFVNNVVAITPQKQKSRKVFIPQYWERNVDDVLQVPGSLWLTEYHRVTPTANWNDGEDHVMMTSIPRARRASTEIPYQDTQQPNHT